MSMQTSMLVSRQEQNRLLFLKQVDDALQTCAVYIKTIASNNESELETKNILAAASLNLLKATTGAMKKDGDETSLAMGAAKVAEFEQRLVEEAHQAGALSNARVQSAIKNYFAYMKVAMTGADVPVLPSPDIVIDEHAFQQAFSTFLGKQHGVDQIVTEPDESGNRAREHARLARMGQEAQHAFGVGSDDINVSDLISDYRGGTHVRSMSRAEKSRRTLEEQYAAPDLCGESNQLSSRRLEWLANLKTGDIVKFRNNREEVRVKIIHKGESAVHGKTNMGTELQARYEQVFPDE